MTRIKKEIPKKKVGGERIRRIPDQKKIVNNKNVKVTDIDLKKFLDSMQINFAEMKESQNESNQDSTMSTGHSDVTLSADVEHKSEDEKKDEQPMESTSCDEVAPTVEKENEGNLSTPKKDSVSKDDEDWSGVELVGLSPDVQTSTSNQLQSDENPQDHGNGDDNDTLAKTENKEENEAKDDGVENTVEAESAEDGYNSGDEAGSDQETESELDERRQPPASKGYSEESESGAGSDGEKERNDGNLTDGSYSADEEDDLEIESGGDENADEKEAEIDVKSPTFVPRRTGFWDHDDRFADINVQETREPQGNRKLWDKSDVNRWQHDKYIEAEQGPKEQWEVEQTIKELDERERRRRSGGRRGGRNFGDFVNFGSRGRGGRNNRQDGRGGYERDGGRGGYARGGGRGGYDRETFGNRQRKDEWSSNDNIDKDKLNWQQDSYRHDHWEDSRTNRQNQKSKDYDRNKKGYRKEKDSERNQRSRDRKNDDVIDEDQDGDRKYREKIPASAAKNASERQEYGKKKGLGRGRGMTRDENKLPRDKTNREKRIDQLPPRLRDNARKKFESEERAKHQKYDEEYDEKFQDVSDEEVKSPDDGGKSPDDGVARDKPKRYSSQRQKPGTSMLDIAGQIPEDEESKSQYLDLVHQTMYNAQVLAMQQHNPNHQGMISNDESVKMLEHQILHLQSQLQQQLNLRSQAQMSNMVAVPPMQNLPQMQVPNVDQQVYGNDALAYGLNQALIQQNTSAGVTMPNPQINPVILNQIMAAAGVQQPALPLQGGSGLFVPSMQPAAATQHHMQVSDADQQSSRRSRPAAIPIKPPPGL